MGTTGRFGWPSLSRPSGGVLASFCIQYADNIAKNFATSISIIIELHVLRACLRFPLLPSLPARHRDGPGLDIPYNGPDGKRGRPPPINIVSYEKTTIDITLKLTTDDGKLGPGPQVGISTSRPASPMLHHARVLLLGEEAERLAMLGAKANVFRNLFRIEPGRICYSPAFQSALRSPNCL